MPEFIKQIISPPDPQSNFGSTGSGSATLAMMQRKTKRDYVAMFTKNARNEQ